MDMERKEALAAMVAFMERNMASGVLTSNEIHPDIPTMHGISTREGARLRCTGEVRHCGFGLFIGGTPHGEFTFDGGGAMRGAITAEGDHDFSWTPFMPASGAVRPQLVLSSMGYDRGRVLEGLKALLSD